MAVPGLTPTSPVTTVGPVLVTVEDPSTEKLAALPRGGAVWAIATDETESKTSPTRACVRKELRFID
jgi:hypothetical protein